MQEAVVFIHSNNIMNKELAMNKEPASCIDHPTYNYTCMYMYDCAWEER